MSESAVVGVATSDSRMAEAIRASFARDPALRSQVIHVQVARGAVTLDGSVPTLAARWRAERLVEAFNGASSIADALRVTTPVRRDEEIAHDARDAITRDPATRNRKVDATVSDATVTLRGAADSYVQQRLLAIAVAKVRGVRAVDLALTVPPRAARSDAELAADVMDGFADDGRLDGTRLSVQVHGRDAVLAGVVGSLAQRAAAVEDAREAGVVAVDGEALRVDGNASLRDLGADRPPPTDAHLADAVRRALGDDSRLGGRPPRVSVELGAVTLSGEVVDFRAARAADRDARGVSGVEGVDDRTTVLPAKVEGDASIQQLATQTVYNDTAVSDARNVRISTRSGRVTLQGAVASREEMEALRADVEDIPGVVSVDNQLQIAGYGPETHAVSATSLRHDVIEAIFWDPRVDRGRVTVAAVDNGDVTLTGTVERAGQSRAAADDALGARAAHVLNHIRVLSATQPSP